MKNKIKPIREITQPLHNLLKGQNFSTEQEDHIKKLMRISCNTYKTHIIQFLLTQKGTMININELITELEKTIT